MLPPIQSVSRDFSRKKKSLSSRTNQSDNTSESSFFQILQGKVESADASSGAGQTGSVSDPLNQEANAQIESLFREFQHTERNLLDFPSTQTFEEYKSNVKDLLSLLIKKSFTIKVYKDARKREYEVVRTVDSSLQQLYSEIAKKSQTMDRSLSILGKIRGLLLDLHV